MIKFGWDCMVWENVNVSAKPEQQRPDGDNYDIKTMWHYLAQGDNTEKLAAELKVVLDEIDCHEWYVPENFPSDIVEWTFTAETVAFDIQEWSAQLIALDIEGGHWVWSYHPDKGAQTILTQSRGVLGFGKS